LVKITFIIPHQEIEAKVHAFISEIREERIVFSTTHIVGTQEAFLSECDSDIVIARGITYLALKRNLLNVSVIEISITGYDIIRALDACKKQYQAKKIAIIAAESIIYEEGFLDDILHTDIEVYKIQNEEDVVQALRMAKEHQVDAVVGGLTACRIAKNRGWQCVQIHTGEEAIRRAINEALSAAYATRLERAKAELLKVILENTKEAIVAVDQDGGVTAFNKAAYKTLNIPFNRQMTGRAISSVIPDFDTLNTADRHDAEIGVLKNINGRMILIEWAPIRVESKTVGVVYTLQNVDKIQETESIIRKELSRKGLVAKYSFGNIIGSSRVLNKTIQTAYKYSQVHSNILLMGETGTGKELFAQSIHNASSRSLEPFVAVNCAAVPENLLESELFGYVEGAFSGAVKSGKTGLFEFAHKGTIFLDEISEIPMNLQAKLLRVLQEREIRKVGDTSLLPIDVRVIASTNINLLERVRNGQFRQDLLYRLDVLNLRIPSLRERGEDIQYIAEYYIEVYCKQYGKPTPELSPGAVAVLSRNQWPGNVRELRNICERLVVLSDQKVITADEVTNLLVFSGLHADAPSDENSGESAMAKLAEADWETLVKLMKVMKVNKAEMAGMLGLSRTTLWRKLKEK
jgi:propionate catabolism operon transcriptional regulator